METDTTSRSNLLPSNFDSRGGSVGYSLCNTLWGPKLVPCTVESTHFPLHDSLLTVRQTDIQSPVWMITLLLTMTLSFMCNLCEGIHTPFYGDKKSQAQLLFSANKDGTKTFHSWWWSFCFTVALTRNFMKGKKKTDQCGSGAVSKKQVYWIIRITLLTKNLEPLQIRDMVWCY